jgi:hypothetical protein
MKLACRSAALSANAFLSDLHAFVMPKIVYRSHTKNVFRSQTLFCGQIATSAAETYFLGLQINVLGV